MLVKSKETSKKSVIVIAKPCEVGELPIRLRYFIQKVESFFFEFEEKFELLDFAPIRWKKSYDRFNFDRVTGYFLVK